MIIKYTDCMLGMSVVHFALGFLLAIMSEEDRVNENGPVFAPFVGACMMFFWPLYFLIPKNREVVIVSPFFEDEDYNGGNSNNRYGEKKFIAIVLLMVISWIIFMHFSPFAF